MKKGEGWLHGVARDTLALGSIPFYAIVIGRAIVGGYLPFVIQVLVGAGVLLLSLFITREANYHLARGLVLVVFTSLFYNAWTFTLFAAVLFICMIVASIILKKGIRKNLIGLSSGAIATIISYLLTPLIA